MLFVEKRKADINIAVDLRPLDRILPELRLQLQLKFFIKDRRQSDSNHRYTTTAPSNLQVYLKLVLRYYS
jgi:hypothetical protein